MDSTMLLVVLLILIWLCNQLERGEMPKYLVVENLAKLLQERMQDPDLEAEYRRGFTDGIGAFFQELDALPPEIEKADLTDAVWRWWTKLMAWHQYAPDESEPPPAFVWQEGDGGGSPDSAAGLV